MKPSDYETIIYRHNIMKGEALAALDIVKKFILRKGLILTGGMAIDIALRSIGKHLYEGNKLPDYDFYSSEHHRDAYDLGTIMAAKLDHISVITALHTTTMRVRVNFQEAADITFVPKSILERMPTITHMGFTIVHPHYQMIDQHRALSLPYELPPLETLFARWEKDIIRYNMLSQEFPVLPVSVDIDIIDYKVKIRDLSDCCLSGLVSLLYWMSEAKSDGFTDTNNYLAGCSLKISNDVIVKLPSTVPFTLLADDVVAVTKKFQNADSIIKKYRPVVDKINTRTTITNTPHKYTIIDNYGNLRSATKTKHQFYVSNLQESMGYLLTMGLLYKNKFCINAYTVANQLLFYARTKYLPGNKFIKYLPSTDTYGKENIYAARIVSRQRLDSQLIKKPITLRVPKNVYPRKTKSIAPSAYDFDPSKEELFLIDGTEIDVKSK